MAEEFLKEVEIEGATYGVGRLNARQQLHVARRLAPLLGTASENGERIAQFANILATMADADVDYVTDTCLGVCKQKQPGGFSPVLVRGGGLLNPNLPLAVYFGLTVHVITENLGGFFASALLAS